MKHEPVPGIGSYWQRAAWIVSLPVMAVLLAWICLLLVEVCP